MLRRAATAPPGMPKGVVVDRRLRLGRGPRAPTCPGARRSSTRPTSRASPCCHPDVPEHHARHLRGPWPTRPSSSTCRSWASRRWSCLPVHESADESFLGDKGLHQLLGLQHAGLLRPGAALRQPQGAAARQVAEFKSMVKALHARRHRGHPRRGLQPHLRGQPPRAHAVAQGHRQRRLLLAHAEDARYYLDFTGCGNSVECLATPTRASSSWTRCATGWRRCTWTASASTWPPRWAGTGKGELRHPRRLLPDRRTRIRCSAA